MVEELPRTVSGSLTARRAPRADEALDLPTALALAKAQIELGRREGDPRAYGRAEAILARFTKGEQIRAEVLVMRATVRQFFHDFDGALADLRAALEQDPANAQAWLTRAVVEMVQGDLSAARKSCGRLLGRASELIAAACLSQSAALSGESDKARKVLESGLAHAAQAPLAERGWATALLAELEDRAGSPEKAEKLYRQALDIDPTDTPSRAALADLLIRHGRMQDAWELTKDWTSRDALLLRAVIATRALAAPVAAALHEDLKDRILAAEMRADRAHLREAALYAMRVERDPARAVRFAKANFEKQREPVDLLVLAEAGAGARDLDALRIAAQWLQSTKLEFPQVAEILKRSQS